MSVWSSIGKFLFGLGSSTAHNPTGVIKAIPSIISGDIPGAVSSILAPYESQLARNEQMKDTKALMTYQNDMNISNWKMQNEYNTPANQMQRIIAAGINPLSLTPDGGNASQPSAVSGQSAPDISSLLQYQLQAQLQHEQIRLLKQQERSQRIENEAAEAEKDLRVANAKDELQVGSMRGKAPDERDWQFDVDSKVWYLEESDKDGNPVIYVIPGSNRRQDAIRARLDREVTDAQAAEIARSAAQIERDLRKKFGEQLTQAQINQISAAAMQASVSGQLDKLDLDLLQKIGVGKSIASPVLSQVLTVAGKLAAKAILKK